MGQTAHGVHGVPANPKVLGTLQEQIAAEFRMPEGRAQTQYKKKIPVGKKKDVPQPKMLFPQNIVTLSPPPFPLPTPSPNHVPPLPTTTFN